MNTEVDFYLSYLIPSQTSTEEIVSTVLSIPSAIRPADPEMKPKVSFKMLRSTCAAIVTAETILAEKIVSIKKGITCCICSAISRPPEVRKYFGKGDLV